MVVHAYNPDTWEVEAEGSGIQGQSRLHKDLKVTLGYMRPCLQNRIKSLIFPAMFML